LEARRAFAELGPRVGARPRCGKGFAAARRVDDALGLAGILSMTAVVLVWGLWLASQAEAPKMWRAVPFAMLPCVAIPLVLEGVFSDHLLGDVAKGTLLLFAVLVSVGTLVHAARARLEG
jgi:hypothetical protein